MNQVMILTTLYISHNIDNNINNDFTNDFTKENTDNIINDNICSLSLVLSHKCCQHHKEDVEMRIDYLNSFQPNS